MHKAIGDHHPGSLHAMAIILGGSSGGTPALPNEAIAQTLKARPVTTVLM